MLALQVMGGIKRIDMDFRIQAGQRSSVKTQNDILVRIKHAWNGIDFMNGTDLYFKCNRQV
jgi:hypothetical protein